MSNLTNLTFAERRQWFEEYTRAVEQGILPLPPVGLRYPCPCCGYPTLTERESWDICSLCYWEDDGQDDPEADEVWGGPNYSYSLSTARTNFDKYLIKFSPDGPVTSHTGNTNSSVQHKVKLGMISAFDKMVNNADQEVINTLWQHVLAYEKLLRLELHRLLKG